MKVIKLLIFSAIILFLLRPFSYAEAFNRVIAIINDDVITLHELDNKFIEMTGRTMKEIKDLNENEYLVIRQKILDYLIDEKIADEKIRELGIVIDSDRVDNAIEDIKKKNNITHESLIEELEKNGITYEKYREKIRKDIERSTLINYEVKSKIIIREEQVQKYYEQNQEKYMEKGYVHLAGIFLMGEKSADGNENTVLVKKSKEIMSRLQDGEEFEVLAKEFSQGPGAEEGGDLGMFQIQKLDEDLLDIVKGMDVGAVSGPINRGNGIQIFKLTDKREARIKPYAEVKEAIYNFLYQEEINNRYSSWIKDLRDKTYTKIIF